MPRPKRAVFLQNDKEYQLMFPQTLRSPAAQADFKAWLVGVIECLTVAAC